MTQLRNIEGRGVVPVGRKSLLTPELQEAMVEAIRVVRYMSVAAEAVGIHVQTANRWMKLGEKHLTKWHPENDDCTEHCDPDAAAQRSFFTAIKKARAQATKEGLSSIKKHGESNWQAQAWIEERTNPELFALKTKHEHTGEGGGPIVHKLLSGDQKQELIKAMQESLLLEQNSDGVFELTEGDSQTAIE